MVEKVPSFKVGGAYWFTDLTTPDPSYALPILTGLTFLATVEVSNLLHILNFNILIEDQNVGLNLTPTLIFLV